MAHVIKKFGLSILVTSYLAEKYLGHDSIAQSKKNSNCNFAKLKSARL